MKSVCFNVVGARRVLPVGADTRRILCSFAGEACRCSLTAERIPSIHLGPASESIDGGQALPERADEVNVDD